MSEVSAAQLEAQQANNRSQADYADAIRRLLANPDFQTVIMEGFMKRDCARYAMESADPLLQPEERQDALNLAQAAGHLKRYITIQMRMGDHAKGNLPELEEQIAHARAFEDWRRANPNADESEFYGEPA